MGREMIMTEWPDRRLLDLFRIEGGFIIGGSHGTGALRKGGKTVVMPLAPRTARAIDLVVGERFEGTPEVGGKLYLHIGPSPWNQQSNGSYEVKIGRNS